MSSSNKWQVCNTILICRILNLSAREPLWKMARKMVKNFYTKKEYYQFHAGYLSYLNLKQNNLFKEEVDKFLSSRFDSKTSTQMKKTLKQDNTRVIALIMFYKNRKSLIFQGVGCCCLFIHRKICLF